MVIQSWGRGMVIQSWGRGMVILTSGVFHGDSGYGREP